MDAKKNNADDLKKMYQSEYCITLDELPKDLYKGSSETDPTTPEPTTETVSETSTEPATDATSVVTTETSAATPTDVTETTASTDVKPTETTVTESTEVTEPSSSESTDVHYGDVNLDGNISIADAVLLNKYLVKSAELTDRAIANADCYKNGTPDANDTLTILKVIVGTYEESQLPIIPEA